MKSRRVIVKTAGAVGLFWCGASIFLAVFMGGVFGHIPGDDMAACFAVAAMAGGIFSGGLLLGADTDHER